MSFLFTSFIEFRISNGYKSFSRKPIFEALSSMCPISIIYAKLNKFLSPAEKVTNDASSGNFFDTSGWLTRKLASFSDSFKFFSACVLVSILNL
jgi:hypothetical protein